jgi:peptidyl-prolyl cis-trans isomerase B (cyclophilin B)
MRKFVLLALSLALVFGIQAQTKTTPTKPKPKTPVANGRLVELKTDYGTMIIKLYDSTPSHRDNFIKLVKQGFYDSLLFHRIIKDFMIQGGDPQSKDADSTTMLGNGEAPGDMIPAEFRSDFIHKKGALAMARTDNPAKASSNCQFYIVQGKVTGDTLLNQVECSIRQNSDMGFYYTDAQRNTYKTIGGTPFLDQNYTVFGEVIKGLDVIDKIAAVQTDPNDRPVKNIRMKMRMLN